jgi:ubiquinone/menaquinone biosynthesis C-methylase UbiE
MALTIQTSGHTVDASSWEMSQVNTTFQNFKFEDAWSYDCVTSEFERFTDQLTQPLAARMVSFAKLQPSQQVLDVGTGTGIVALEAARRIGSEGKVLGIDLSDGMLATAISKAARAGLANCEFRKMDAESLEINNQSFDVVLSLFALLHLPDPLKGLKEMFRVLRPGGRLVLAVGSGAPLWSWNGLAHRVRSLPDLLRRVQGRQLTAPGFLNNLVDEKLPKKNGSEETQLAQHTATRTKSVNALVRKAGFAVLANDWEGHETILETPEEFWEIQRTFSSIARKRLAGASPEEVDGLRQAFLHQCRDVHARGGRLVYPFGAFYVTAVRR